LEGGFFEGMAKGEEGEVGNEGREDGIVAGGGVDGKGGWGEM